MTRFVTVLLNLELLCYRLGGRKFVTSNFVESLVVSFAKDVWIFVGILVRILAVWFGLVLKLKYVS